MLSDKNKNNYPMVSDKINKKYTMTSDSFLFRTNNDQNSSFNCSLILNDLRWSGVMPNSATALRWATVG